MEMNDAGILGFGFGGFMGAAVFGFVFGEHRDLFRNKALRAGEANELGESVVVVFDEGSEVTLHRSDCRFENAPWRRGQ